MVNSRRGDIATRAGAGIATLPQEFCTAVSPKVGAGGTVTCRFTEAYQENLQAIARNVPCVHSMFIEVSIVPAQDKPFCSGIAQ
jgi:hypothetical protein